MICPYLSDIGAGTASAVRFSNCCHVLINRERGGGVQFSYGFRCVKTIVTLRSSGSWESVCVCGGGGGEGGKEGGGVSA